MAWYPLIGWPVFFVGAIISIVLFSNMKRLYPVFYTASISLYIFTAGFFIDAFDLKRGAILAVLVVSAILFMLVGYYFSKVFHSNKK